MAKLTILLENNKSEAFLKLTSTSTELSKEGYKKYQLNFGETQLELSGLEVTELEACFQEMREDFLEEED